MINNRRTQLEIAISDLRAQITAKEQEVSQLRRNITVLENAQIVLSGGNFTPQIPVGDLTDGYFKNITLRELPREFRGVSTDKSTTLALPSKSDYAVEPSVLRGMGSNEAMVEIARRNGTVRPAQIGQLLIDAGCTKSPNAKLAANSAYQLALHNPLLKKTEPGIFGLSKSARSAAA